MIISKQNQLNFKPVTLSLTFEKEEELAWLFLLCYTTAAASLNTDRREQILVENFKCNMNNIVFTANKQLGKVATALSELYKEATN